MKKFLSILLIVVLLISLSACKKNGSKNGTNENKTTADVIKIEYFIDDTFENKISFNIPENLKDKYIQKTSSSFSDGYYSVTICVKDTDFDLFTIYCSKNDSYKNFFIFFSLFNIFIKLFLHQSIILSMIKHTHLRLIYCISVLYQT